MVRPSIRDAAEQQPLRQYRCRIEEQRDQQHDRRQAAEHDQQEDLGVAAVLGSLGPRPQGRAVSRYELVLARDDQQQEVVVPHRDHIQQQHGHPGPAPSAAAPTEKKIRNSLRPRRCGGRVDELATGFDTSATTFIEYTPTGLTMLARHTPDRVDQVDLGVAQVRRQGDRRDQRTSTAMTRSNRAGSRGSGTGRTRSQPTRPPRWRVR